MDVRAQAIRNTLRPRRGGWAESRLIHRGRPSTPAPAPVEASLEVGGPLHRGPLGGGPEDHALYQCGCGYMFDAAVCTTVGCPHCGQTQAW